VKSPFESVFQALKAEFGDIYAREFGKPGESLRGVILGEHYFFRVENDAALLVTLEEASSAETRIEIIACAAGHGLMGDLLWCSRLLCSYSGRFPCEFRLYVGG
jgi:predicted component of type VI protein secretion system